VTTDLALSPFENAVLNTIQCDFPLSPDPYAEIAQRVGGTQDEVHATVMDLRRRGIIRRIGGTFVAKELGYVSVLVAARVTPAELVAVAAVISEFPEVTHNYERGNSYNLWFTVIAENDARLEEILSSVRCCEGVEAVHPLPATRTFKIRVDFKFNEESIHAE